MKQAQVLLSIAISLLFVVFLTLAYVIFLLPSKTLTTPDYFKKIVFKDALSIDHVSFNPENNCLYVADSTKGEIYVCNENGKIIGKIEKRSYGKKGFLEIKDILSYENGVLVSDSSQRQIFFARPGKTPTEFIDTTMSVFFKPGALSRGDYLSIYVADEGQPVVYNIGPDGKVLKRLTYRVCSDCIISGLSYERGALCLAVPNYGEIFFIGALKEKKVKLSGRKGSYYPLSFKTFEGNFVIADPFYQEVIIFNQNGKEVASFGFSIQENRRLDVPVDFDIYGRTFFVAEKRERSVSIWKVAR